MTLMLTGEATDAHKSAYLTALRIKGETVDEVVSSCLAMKAQGAAIAPAGDYIDFVGTGGDGTNSFNISTTSMFVCGAAGVKIAKHGNRASSSKSGASDLLEALGVNIMLSPEQTLECINEIGFGFMNAQKFYGAMKNVAGVRREIGIRTLFNMLGPLSNPSNAKYQVIGVFDKPTARMFAECMQKLGAKKALVVNGSDGMDEVTITGKTFVCEIKDGEILEYEIDPHDYGMEYGTAADIKGGTGADNAEITLSIFKGEQGARRNIILLNAGCGMYIGGKADSIADGIKLAAEMIDSGKALDAVDKLVKKTQSFA
jgi:anthranilate phosphoribosyltransferase